MLKWLPVLIDLGKIIKLTSSFSYLLIDLTIEIDWNGSKCYTNVAQQECNNKNTTLQLLKIYIYIYIYYIDNKQINSIQSIFHNDIS